MQHFVLQTPSLQHVAGVKIVTHLWTQADIFTFIAQSFNGLQPHERSKGEEKWRELLDKLNSQVRALPLPVTCKKDLFNFIRPIVDELMEWFQYHYLGGHLFTLLETLLPQQFCWSMHGTVDFKKTAELIVKDERFSIERRMEVACLNCLEDEAWELLELIPNQRIHEYITEALSYGKVNHRLLIVYFACTLSGDEDTLNRLIQAMDLGGWSINQYLFKVVLHKGTRATCEYFLQKVNQLEKWQVLEDGLLRTAFRSQQSPTCGLLYYLSLLNEKQQQVLFEEYTGKVLICLLRWPMQSLFLEAAQRGREFIRKYSCADVLSDIAFIISDGFQDYDYVQLFWKCWRLTPHKRHFLSDFDELDDLFRTKRREFIQLVFNKAPSTLLRMLSEVKDLYEEVSLELKGDWDFHRAASPNMNRLVEIKEIYDRMIQVLMDESVMSDVILMECKKTAALKSSNDKENEEKKLRSKYVKQLVNVAMKSRFKRRRPLRSDSQTM